MSSSDNEDRRMEAAALHMLQEARIGIVFSIPKDKKHKDDVVQGRYFSWIASHPPTFHMSRPLADIIADRDLTVQVDIDGLSLTIPRLVYEICTYLKRSRQLGTEGLFRKSGNASRVRMLQQHLDAYGRLPAKDIKQHKYTCHDMVQVLKAFLRHLPGGIINFLYKSFVVAQRVKSEQDPVTQRTEDEATEFGLNLTMCLCYLLPSPHQHLLQYLMHFFVDRFGPAQEQKQQHNTMTLDNLAKILGPSILPTNTTSRPGMEDNSEYVIAAVRDMMLGYRRGLLYTSYLKTVCERATRISPREAQRIYKSGFLDKMTKPKRRSRASGLGDAIRSAGGEVMKQLQRKGSSKSNIEEQSTSRPTSANTTPKTRRHGRRSLGDPATMANIASSSSHDAWSSSSSSSKSERPRSLKRRSGSVHTESGEEHARQRCKFGEDPEPKRAPVSAAQRPGRIISATEAKRKGLEMAPVLDPRQQATAASGKENAGNKAACVSTVDETSGVARRTARAGTPRTRRRSFEGMRRLSGGLSGSAKKVKNFMRRRSSRSSSEPRETKSESETVATQGSQKDGEVASAEQDDNFLDLLPKADHNDSDVITLEELSLFSQMCYETQKKYESTKTIAATPAEAGVVDPRNAARAFSAPPSMESSLSSSSSSTNPATTTNTTNNSNNSISADNKKVRRPVVPVAAAQELHRPPRKTRVGQPPVIRHPAAGYSVGRMGRTGETPTRALLQSHGYSSKRFGIRAHHRRKTADTSPSSPQQQSQQQQRRRYKKAAARDQVLQESYLSVEKPSFQRSKQGSSSSKSGSTKSQRTALGNIDNTAKSPNARSKMNTPLLQKEDRFTFV